MTFELTFTDKAGTLLINVYVPNLVVLSYKIGITGVVYSFLLNALHYKYKSDMFSFFIVLMC